MTLPPLLCESATITPLHRRILLLSFLGWMFDFYNLILYTFLTRPISAELGLTRLDHGWAIGLTFAATALGGVASGYLADRFGRRPLIVWTILLYSLGCLLSGLAGSKALLFVARAITGLGVGGEWAAGHALVAETFPPDRRGRAGALLQTGAPVGVGLATLVGTLVAPAVGWRACLIGSSLTAALVFVARRSLPESDLWQRGRSAEFGRGVGALLAGALAPAFYAGLVLTVLNGASYWLTYSWLPEYLRTRGLTVAASGLYLGVMVVGELIGYSSFGWFSDRLGRRPAFTLFSVVMAAGLVPLAACWPELAGTPGLYLAVVFVGLGTGTWSNFGPMLAELFPTPLRNTAMGSILNLARGVQFAGPPLIAALEPRYGLAAGLGLAAGFALAAAGWVWILPETRGRPLGSAL
ncbi:MAG TPA: MFS transporter [Candidatus Polarisedimenticolaceae bacterium]|nr:MFS transporter [Candidatus Polarisedimenticolaceae bacterium]